MVYLTLVLMSQPVTSILIVVFLHLAHALTPGMEIENT